MFHAVSHCQVSSQEKHLAKKYLTETKLETSPLFSHTTNRSNTVKGLS